MAKTHTQQTKSKENLNINQQSTVRTAHMCAYQNVIHNTAQNSSDSLPFILQTIIIAQMLSTG